MFPDTPVKGLRFRASVCPEAPLPCAAMPLDRACVVWTDNFFPPGRHFALDRSTLLYFQSAAMVVSTTGSRKLTIAGWVLSGIVAAFLALVSAAGKFIQPPPQGTVEISNHLGLPLEKFPGIGVLEIACVVLFLIPRTAFVGAILLAGYHGGAAAIHVRVGDPWVFPILIGVLAWVGYGLRRPDVIRTAFAPRPGQPS